MTADTAADLAFQLFRLVAPFKLCQVKQKTYGRLLHNLKQPIV